jgi:hypothetical protein
MNDSVNKSTTVGESNDSHARRKEDEPRETLEPGWPKPTEFRVYEESATEHRAIALHEPDFPRGPSWPGFPKLIETSEPAWKRYEEMPIRLDIDDSPDDPEGVPPSDSREKPVDKFYDREVPVPPSESVSVSAIGTGAISTTGKI